MRKFALVGETPSTWSSRARVIRFLERPNPFPKGIEIGTTEPAEVTELATYGSPIA